MPTEERLNRRHGRVISVISLRLFVLSCACSLSSVVSFNKSSSSSSRVDCFSLFPLINLIIIKSPRDYTMKLKLSRRWLGRKKTDKKRKNSISIFPPNTLFVFSQSWDVEKHNFMSFFAQLIGGSFCTLRQKVVKLHSNRHPSSSSSSFSVYSNQVVSSVTKTHY